MIRIAIQSFLFVVGAASVPFLVFGQVMESSSYRIQADSINFGGQRSTSASYISEDTLGEIATGESESSTYRLKAGYQQMTVTAIAITSPADVSMTNISASGGTSNASVAWTVTTDDPAGYSLSILASSDPALSSGMDNFADYTPAGSDPDYEFSVAASNSEFGYSPEGNDVASRFLDDGTSCNSGASETSERCWDGFTTSNVTIATGSSANHPTGAGTTVRLRAEIGSSVSQPAGTYTATLTVTAVTL